jgi:hypothetical protein
MYGVEVRMRRANSSWVSSSWRLRSRIIWPKLILSFTMRASSLGLGVQPSEVRSGLCAEYVSENRENGGGVADFTPARDGGSA